MDRRTALKIAGAAALAVAAGSESAAAFSRMDGTWVSSDGYVLSVAGGSVTATNPDGESKTMSATVGLESIQLAGSPVSFQYAQGPPETLTRSSGKIFTRQ